MRFQYVVFIWEDPDDENNDDLRDAVSFKKKSRCEAFIRNNNLHTRFLSFSKIRVSPFVPQIVPPGTKVWDLGRWDQGLSGILACLKLATLLNKSSG